MSNPHKRPLSPPPSSPPPGALPPSYLSPTPQTLRQKFHAVTAHEAQIRASPTALYTHPVAHARNRYPAIRPWAHNRVELSALDFPYINASPIDLGRAGETFIAAQGPVESEEGRGHFWEMCWQEGVEVVVMLTQAVEEGREKCAVYYPEAVEGVLGLGDWGRVKCVGLSEEHRTEVREIRVVKNMDAEDGEVREVERTVWHFLFLGWPDMEVPKETGEFLELIKMSRFKIDAGADGAAVEKVAPRVVHCSAGVGRTGTFIALDHLLHQFDDGELEVQQEASAAGEEGQEVDPIFETVKKLREQRMYMVYQPAQFAFVYQVLKEKWLAREKGLETPRPKLENFVEEGSPTKKRKSMGGDSDVLLDVGPKQVGGK